jgi:hypothetical protein
MFRSWGLIWSNSDLYFNVNSNIFSVWLIFVIFITDFGGLVKLMVDILEICESWSSNIESAFI